MKYKTEQCYLCEMNCPVDIIKAKINKGRILFGECLDFRKIHTNAELIRHRKED